MGRSIWARVRSAPFAIDWQDSDRDDSVVRAALDECPQGRFLWQDQAPHHTSERWKIG